MLQRGTVSCSVWVLKRRAMSSLIARRSSRLRADLQLINWVCCFEPAVLLILSQQGNGQWNGLSRGRAEIKKSIVKD